MPWPEIVKLIIGVPLAGILLYAMVKGLVMDRWGWKYRKRRRK